MTRVQRRVAWRTAQLGLLLTMLVIIVDSFGWLEPLERYFYDVRARRCQFFTPPPSPVIYHLDIDDQSLAAVGRWPWPRATMSRLIDEIAAAGAKVIALDILYGNPERPEFRQAEDGSVSVTDHDALLAAALGKANNALVPVQVTFAENKPVPPIVSAMIDALTENPELESDELARALVATREFKDSDVRAAMKESFLFAAERGMYLRLERELSNGLISMDAVSQRVLPKWAASGQRSDARTWLEQAYPTVVSVLRVRSFGQPLPKDAPVLVAQPTEATIPQICDVAKYVGFVDFLPMSGGSVRFVPLAANYRGQLLPHMSLATACAILGVDPRRITYTSDEAVIPIDNGQPIHVPLQILKSARFGNPRGIMNIPWFGGSEWLTMYDFPRCAEPKQHDSLKNVWKICEYDDDVKKNDDATYLALNLLKLRQGVSERAEFVRIWPELKTAGVQKLIDDTLADENIAELIKYYRPQKPEELDEDGRQFLSAVAALGNDAREQRVEKNKFLRQQQVAARTALREKLNGRAVIIGWTATGGGDSYPTSLHAQCPGVMIQSTIVNAILTRHLWRTEPQWMVALVTLAIGALATGIAALMPPWRGLLLTALLIGGYLAVNGVVVFDYGDRILGVAGPVSAAVLVWGGLTLVRSIYEATERARITKRFRSYVDPALVDYMIEHPELPLDGQQKEMTVVFTDLAGFTTLSEALRERSIPLLNDYMGIMVPIIHANRGLRNKFLGDGIMFFFNAPSDNPHHANDAVRTVLQMQDAVKEFNKGLIERNLPQVAMRAGISTGHMVVGDAGALNEPFRANDYTVLGDVVNLGARLEGANKAVGTKSLVNERARELLGNDEFLVRPVGRLQVVGKTEGVMTFEPMCRQEEATPEQRKLAEMTDRMVTHYCAAEFDRCIAVANEIDGAMGPSKLTALYVKLSKRMIASPPADGWDGLIVLEEK